jgi:uncharacterized FAD-dependent dehydrogenase
LNNLYDRIYVGAGPATIFSLIKSAEIEPNFKDKKILVIEKGKSLSNRKRTEVVSGFAGAGCFSDCKLTSGLETGGNIPWLESSELKDFSDWILKVFNQFKLFTKDSTPLTWDKVSSISNLNDLEWLSHQTCHVGTDNGTQIFKVMEDYLKFFNIEFKFRSEVENVTNHKVKDVELLKDNLCIGNNLLLQNNYYPYEVTLTDGSFYRTANLIIATGQKNTLPEIVIKNFELSTKPRAFQLGIRVEDTMNKVYENFVKANYDFKIQKTYDYKNNVKIRVRTFCVNSGNAHVCEEKNDEGFSCFNGHAFHNGIKTDKINYGLICEVEGMPCFNTKQSQIDLMKLINSNPSWKSDNFEEDGVTLKGTSLNNLSKLNYYPEEVYQSLKSFIESLGKVVNLSKAHYFYPEVKLSGFQPILNENFETEYPGLFIIGDASMTRGIIKAAYTGTKVSEVLANKSEEQELLSRF